MINQFMNAPLVSLYVHFPWCIKKCPYCDFHSLITSTIPEKPYIDALIKDADTELTRLNSDSRKIISIFFGGGTPSLFSPQSMERLLNHITRVFPIDREIEITMEVNPGTIQQNDLYLYREAGINRLSLGIQSFQDLHLKKIGRIHDSREAKNAIQQAKQAGFSNINIDLMYGLPEQTIEEALLDLKIAFEMEPTHLSWYQLTLEPHTPFGKNPPLLPSDENLFKIERLGQQLLRKQQYVRYEISAYAKNNRQCQHNLNYWQYGDYIGIGAGAHGKITCPETGEIERYCKTLDPDLYLKHRFLAKIKTLRPQDIPLDFMMNALRLIDGVPARLFEERTGLPLSVIRDQLDLAQQQKFLSKSNKHSLKMTQKGLRFLNECLLLF